MSLRDDIRKNMKTEIEVEEEAIKAETERIRHLKASAIYDFRKTIIDNSRKGVGGSIITGTFKVGRFAYPYSESKVIGQKKKTLFSKYTLWKFDANMKTDVMIKLEAIKEFAASENIAISLEITHSYPLKRKFVFDTTNFPTVFATVFGTHYGGTLNEIELGDLNIYINYSISLWFVFWSINEYVLHFYWF